jgi:hypothetical protein
MTQIVYGSLLHPDELKKQHIDIDRVEFVKVKGFRRVFNQEPSWRLVEANERAVMNIEPDPEGWFNALAIKGLSEEHIEELDHRERGYDRINLADGDVVTYGGKMLKECFVYKGKSGKQSDTIDPNPEYFEICLRGAQAHFDRFYRDYISTTYMNKIDQGQILIGV